MDRSQFLILMDELLELEPGTLKGEELLEDLEEWNSLAIVGYMAMVNEHYGRILSSKHFAGCKTVNDLLALTA